MRLRPVVAVSSVVLLASCAAVLGLPDPTLDDTIPTGGGSSSGGSSGGSSGTADSSLDGAQDDGSLRDVVSEAGDSGVLCSAQTPWGNVTPLGGVNDATVSERHPYLSPNELAIVFAASNGDPLAEDVRVMIASRDASTEPFNAPIAFPLDRPLATSPCLARSGLYFTESTPTFDGRLYLARFPDGGAAPGSTVQEGLGGPPGSNLRAFCRTLLDDGGTMYLHREFGQPPQNGAFLVRATSDGPDKWDAGPVAVPLDDGTASSPVVRGDELELFFALRVGSTQTHVIMTSRRTSTSAPWSAPTAVAELNGTRSNIPGWLSPDGCRLYFARDTGSGGNLYLYDLYVATRTSQ